MELKIYNQSGELKLTVDTSSSSTLNQELMTENAVSASFTHPGYVPLDVNDYVMLLGVKFSIKKEYKPKQKNTQTYDYSVKFYAPEHDAQQVMYLNLTDGQYNPQFSLDGNPREHMQKWVDNMNRIYGSAVWSIGDVVMADNQTIEYNNVTCWDALTSISEAFGTEWWADGFVMNLSRCERGEQVELGCIQGLTSLTQSENSNDVKFFTRLIPLGSTKNIDASRYGFSRLQLPDKAKYKDRNTHYGLYEHVEEAAFAEIFPHYTGTITSVRSEEKTGEDKKPFTVYYFKDSGMTFDPCANEIVGLVKHVSFQTGDLAGRDFEANYNTTTKEWEIINTYPSDDVQIPGSNLIPAIGNKYIPWNFRMPVEYEVQAELDYKAAVDDFLTKYSDDVSKYGGDTDYIYIDKNKVSLSLGQRVRLLSDKYFSALEGYRDTRLTKVVRKLDNLSIANIECTNQVGKGWKSQVDSSLSQLKYIVDRQVEQTIFEILKTGDPKAVTEYNILSGKRTLNEIARRALSSLEDDEAAGVIKFLKGLLIGDKGHGFTINDTGIVTAILDELKNVSSITSSDFSSGPFGSGYLLKVNPKTGKSYFEVDEAYFRLKAVFEMLEIKHLSHVGGRIVLSPAGMECIKVEEVAANNEFLYDSSGDQLFDSNNDKLLAPVFDGETAYRCYFKQTDGEKEIVNEFAVGDLAQCREFNIKPGVSSGVSNQYYWRRVMGIGCGYIDLSKTVCDTGSMIPLVGDTIVTVGNDTNKDRQHVVFLSSYDEDAPNIKLYSGINSFSMKGKEVTVISPNADKNLFTGQMIIKPGSTGFENLSDAPDIGIIQEDIKYAQSAASDAKESAGKVQSTVSDLNKYIDGAFADGIISEAEAKSIEKYINIVNSEKSSAESTFNTLYSNPYLEGSAKVSLLNAKSSLLNSVTALVNSINTAIMDGKTTAVEKQEVDSKYAAFVTFGSKFYESVETANKSIQDKLKSYSDNAQKAADEANNNASTAVGKANDANKAVSDLNTYVDGAFSDGIISEAEAKSIEKYINAVNATKKEVEATYTVLYGNSYLEGTSKTDLLNAKTNFTTSVSNLVAAIQAAISDGRTTTAEKNNVDSKYTLFGTAYAAMKTAIENANVSIQEKIRKEAANDAVKEANSQIEKVTATAKNDVAKQMGYTDYSTMQEAARKGRTIITGGEINTELINANLIITTALIADAIKASSLNINNKLIIYKDGSVDMQGILHSIGPNTEVIISDGYLRILYNGTDVMRLAVNQTTGMPELNMKSGNKTLFASPDQLVFGFGSGNSFLSLRPEDIGAGSIRKNSDGTLVVTNSAVTVITVGISCSPQEGGTTSPSPSPLLMRNQGETEYVEALPNAGYQFDRWSDGGAKRHLVTWDKSGKSITAYFAKIQVQQYTVILNASPAGGGSVSGGGTADAGSVKSVSAIPNNGYRFVEWSDKGNATHNVTWDSNKTLTAYFESYSVTGDEILLGTDLLSKTYTETYKVGTLGYFSIGVSGGRMSAMYSGPSDFDASKWGENPGWVFFNKGYLGSKLSKGHKYRLQFTAKTSVDTSRAYVIAAIGSLDVSNNVKDITNNEDVIYGEEITGTDKVFTLDLTPQRDSTVSDSLCMCFLPVNAGALVYISNISLKEI